ncbi:uncharacterized protein LOC135480601 [Liolophura sinensis]|uniref:uncharacterized protein LOC135480601 n=1 Tax=Liolophura sinensis TaxID=3198878 RepID=UPI003158AF89
METGWVTVILLVGVVLGPVAVFPKRVTCLDRPGSNIKVTCPRGEVIMNLKVKVGKSSADPGSSKRCTSNRKHDCMGLTPEVVAQTNNCYFRNQCSVQLSPLMPITNSENRSCLARTPDYAILESWDCICERSLKYVCDAMESDQLVKKSEGRLVSHRSYPWFYPKHGNDRYCRVSFAQQPSYKLTLWSDDIDLDPDGHDNVSLYNVTSEDSQAIGEPLMYSTQGFNETITSSTIQLVFFINQKTKAGRGFIINYKWTAIDSNGETTPGTDDCKDKKRRRNGNKGKKERKMMNRKGKGKNRKKKRRNRGKKARNRRRKSGRHQEQEQ